MTYLFFFYEKLREIGLVTTELASFYAINLPPLLKFPQTKFKALMNCNNIFTPIHTLRVLYHMMY